MYTYKIAQSIVCLRKSRKMSQEKLAFAANVSVTYLRSIEHGRANPSMDTLESLAVALNVPLPSLFFAGRNSRVGAAHAGAGPAAAPDAGPLSPGSHSAHKQGPPRLPGWPLLL